jgi:hypothetical protein
MRSDTWVLTFGGGRYAIDLLVNPKAVSMSTGGMLTDQQLIAGQIGTVATSDTDAVELYSLFARVIRKRFERVKSYYVGTEAARLLDDGVRLSATATSPQAYDLVR